MSRSCFLYSLGNVKTLKDCWLVGDQFLCSIFPRFQQIRSDAIAERRQSPYIYDYYNIFCWTTPVTTVRSVPAKILNSFTEGLNNIHRMPKYVIIMPENDILNGLNYSNQLISNIEAQVKWLIENVGKVIQRRRQDLKEERPGAIGSSFEPMVVWVKMIKRPQADTDNRNFWKAWGSCEAFNEILEENLVCERYMYIMEITSLNDDPMHYFKPHGVLSANGMEQFWKELDYKMKKFNRKQIDLHPKGREKCEASSSKHESMERSSIIPPTIRQVPQQQQHNVDRKVNHKKVRRELEF